VFAYSNRAGQERALVVYHNKYADARGWIRTSAAYAVKTGEDGDRALVQKSLGEGLGLHHQDDWFCIFRDHVSGLEYIRSSKELWEKGLYVELGAYKYHVFLDFREVQDNECHHYAHLAAYLSGRGVPSIEEALRETFLQPIHRAFKELVNAATFQRLMDARLAEPDGRLDQALLDEVEQKTLHLLREIKQFTGATGDEATLAQDMRQQLEIILQSTNLRIYEFTNLPIHQFWGSLLGWWSVHSLGKIVGEAGFEERSRSWMDEWLLGKVIARVLQDLGLDESAAWQSVAVVKLLTSHQRWFAAEATAARSRAYQILESLLKDDEVQQFLQVNRYQGVLWFNKEAFEQLLWWLWLVAVVEIGADPKRAEEISACSSIVEQLRQAGEKSGYQVEKLLGVA
jgi:hypothetical protein